MKFDAPIINLLRAKSGLSLSLSRECEMLSAQIKEQTGYVVSKSTLKRLLGFYTDERMPMAYTLDVIARYLGYHTWQELQEIIEQKNEQTVAIAEEIDLASLALDTLVKLELQQGGEINLRYLLDSHFAVVSCTSGELLENDILVVHSLKVGYFLMFSMLLRNGRNLSGKISYCNDSIKSISFFEQK